jgi:4-hydroxy-3-polyprenylbenzoate decarboxylase
LYEDGEDGEDGDGYGGKGEEAERPDAEEIKPRMAAALSGLSVFSVLSAISNTQASNPLSNPQPERSLSQYPIVLAFTGASGAPYGVRLLDVLARNRIPVWLIVSSHGLRLLHDECGIDSIDGLQQATGGDWTSVMPFPDEDRGALPASGSQRTGGMVVCPCSMGTLSAISLGSSRSLVERAADVALKERRKLVLVPRETPLSAIHLENMLRVTRAGAVVLPASPGFYHQPRQLSDLVDFVVARVLDHLDVEHRLVKRWSSGVEGGGEG